MNGNLPAPARPVAAPVAAANAQQPPVRRRRPPPQSAALRPPRRPLKNITRPLVSLTQMNENKNAPGLINADGTKTTDALRHEFLQQGASSFPLIVTRRDLKELRHHVMRLQSKTRLDIQNPEHFAAPIRLHRRDPRAPPSGAGTHFEEDDTKEDLEEIKERERIEQAKEERRKVREENQAKIAPTGKTKPQAFQKKTEQKYRPDDTPEARKRQLLRYEETLPWHLEDFENKQTWVGTYESELSEAHIMLTQNPNDAHGAIQLAPMERWYRFSVKGKVKPTGDDVDKVMYKVENVPTFLSRIEKRAERRQMEEEQSRSRYGMSTRVGGGADDEGRIRRARNDDEVYVKREADADDIDFNLDEDFADDEEGLNGLFEGEEQDVKEATEKLKRDQLQAALWERPDEEKLREQEEQERKNKEDGKSQEKFLTKKLLKHEKRYDEFGDSDRENPYLSSSESESESEEEREQKRKEEEKKAAEGKTTVEPTPSGASGASTKGTNTPKGASTPKASSSRSSTPKPLTILPGDQKSKSKKRPGSDIESGNESSRKRKKKEKHSSSSSKPSSPAATSPPGPEKVLPTAKEIYEALPPQGMTIQGLIAQFKSRVDKVHTQTFIRLVKAVSSFDKAKSWLTPLPQMPSEELINARLGH